MGFILFNKVKSYNMKSCKIGVFSLVMKLISWGPSSYAVDTKGRIWMKIKSRIWRKIK